MNTAHIEVTPGVGYTVHNKLGSDPLTVSTYNADGTPRMDYIIEAEESAYILAAHTIITLSAEGECEWILTPLHPVGRARGAAGEMKA